MFLCKTAKHDEYLYIIFANVIFIVRNKITKNNLNNNL